jgi:hypothetical protein
MAARRFRVLAVVELENLVLRNRLHVLRRERLDHVVIFNERHLRRILLPPDSSRIPPHQSLRAGRCGVV